MMRGQKTTPKKKEEPKAPEVKAPAPVQEQPEMLGPMCQVCGRPVARGQNYVCVIHQRSN